MNAMEVYVIVKTKNALKNDYFPSFLYRPLKHQKRLKIVKG